jgi:RNA polymerase sigma factor (sigma-70 family)
MHYAESSFTAFPSAESGLAMAEEAKNVATDLEAADVRQNAPVCEQDDLNLTLLTFRELLGQSLHRTRGRVANPRFDTSDVVQESLIQVWSKVLGDAGSVDSISDAWLRKISQGHLSKQRRYHNAAKRSVAREDREYAGDPEAQQSSLTQSELNEWVDNLKKYLGRLDGVQRLIVVRRVFQQLPFQQIADELQTTRYFVRANYKNAIKQLKGWIENGDREVGPNG